jgi:hypothetical protein
MPPPNNKPLFYAPLPLNVTPDEQQQPTHAITRLEIATLYQAFRDVTGQVTENAGSRTMRRETEPRTYTQTGIETVRPKVRRSRRVWGAADDSPAQVADRSSSLHQM